MRFLRVLPSLLAVAVILALNHAFSPKIPALGRIIDPINGAMAAAERTDEDWNRNFQLKDLQAPVQIWMDTSLIPHIRAGNDHDLYYAQGFIHANFRLWQMDLQTRAAGGRVSEVAGPKAIDFDRGIRREGMVWGAQHSLAAMEAEPRTKAMLDAYRDGINAYIHTLNYRRLPIEYKLMGFEPEDWTNLRTALLMKYMARDLTGKTDDIAYTQLRDQLGQEQFDFLFPERIKGSNPVIPEGTKWDVPSMPQPKVPDGDVWAHFKDTATAFKGNDKGSLRPCHFERMYAQHERSSLQDDKDWAGSHESELPISNSELRTPNSEIAVGSNNWAISGAHTASGKPILCNDPHLALNLPSLWYEMQLSAPGINAYGASLPGAPGIVIGFNEKISWGFTNNYRDVKDFYEITDGHTLGGRGVRAYRFCNKLFPYEQSIEVIKVKGGADVIDTVLYTIHGPVTYDPSFPDPAKSGKLLACTWMGHRGSNELLATYLLNRAGDYPAFTDAISHFECPAQNIAYADGAGNIAMWGQGRFINKWKGQGKYVMEGQDSLTLWGADIPMAENPHVLNPPQGYVASANQQVTDSTYPYWYNGSFVEWRSWRINGMLSDLGTKLKAYATRSQLKGWDSFFALPYPRLNMDEMQNDVFSLQLWEMDSAKTSGDMYTGLRLPSFKLNDTGGWLLTPNNDNATFRQIIAAKIYRIIWSDKFQQGLIKSPSSERTMELLRSDPFSIYYDDKATPKKENLDGVFRRAISEATDSLENLKRATGLEWYKVKNTSLTHLAKIPAFSYDHLKIGGWSNTINAATGDHGPSWRMIVEMDSIPKAYAIYPGGQSGNPGSRHYGDFIDQWVEGKYHAIQFLTAATTKNPFKYTWTLTP